MYSFAFKLSKMKREEELVLKYLEANDYRNIIHEPKGQSTPDFSINARIGVEVRRLNQHFTLGTSAEPLESLDYAIHNAFIESMNSFPASATRNCALVSYDFRRPLVVDKKLKQQIKTVMREHLPYIDQRKTYTIDHKIDIEFWPASTVHDTAYVYGSSSDDNSGGFVTGNVYEALQLILQEKWAKVEPVHERYPEWWLALVDYIGYGFSELDLKNFHEHPKLENQFDRILLISPMDPTKGVFLYE